MALADLRLAVMAFPQQWDGSALSLNVLLVPSVDPLTAPLAGTAPPFADHVPALRAVVIPNLDAYPTTDDATAVRPATTVVAPSPRVEPRPVLEQLADLAAARGVTIAAAAPAPVGGRVARIRKALPESYLAITG